MAPFAADTSVLVAALLGWHEKHRESLAAIERRLAEGGSLVLAAHSLFECYAVLTRLPPPHRIAPATALDLLERSFRGRTRVIDLAPRDRWPLLRAAPALGDAGGRTYDLLIAWSVRRGGATEILTLNARHFEGMAEDLRAVAP